jgi:DNA-binding NtrC family response regulator
MVSSPAPTVLLVDDDPVVLRILSRIVDRAGCRFIQAASAAEALRAAGRCPDVCLLDLCLPDGSGLDLAVVLNDRYPDLPLILMTGSSELLRDRSERDRFLRILAKPPDVRAIREAIRAALGKQQSTAAAV